MREIPKGRELTRAERAYVVDVICRWIEREVHGSPGAGNLDADGAVRKPSGQG